jgi:hypothetical protein
MSQMTGITLALLMCGAAVCTQAKSRIVFAEAFDGTGEKPPWFTDACFISEAPPSLKTLCFRPADNKAADVYRGLFMLPKGTPACSDYEFSFKFAFPRDSKKAFTLRLASGDAADRTKQVSSIITISDKSMSINPGAPGLLPPFADSDIRFIPNGNWHNALVRVRGKTMELFVENDGLPRKFAQAEVSGAPLIGFNFAGATAVDFDDILIRRIDPPASDFRTESGVTIANDAAQYTVKVPANAVSAAASIRLGCYPGAMIVKLGYADGGERVIDVKTFASNYDKDVQRQVNELDPEGKLVSTLKTVKEQINLPDAGVTFQERRQPNSGASWALTYHTRPRLQYRYEPDRTLEIVSNWESFPAASQKFIQFELRPDDTGAQLWLDGRYAGYFTGPAKLEALSFVLPAHSAVKDAAVSTRPFGTRYLALDVSKIANPGAMADATVSLNRKNLAGIPFLVADGPGNADTGVCRENLGSFALECDGYLSRTPFDGMPESLLLSVPVAQYTRAYALCAVENDPDKATVITARLTKFLPGSAVGRGPAIADTPITLPRPGEPLPAGVKQIGTVKTGDKVLPLYLVEFLIDSGGIQEIMFQEKPEWLDFEVLGKRNDKDNFYVDRSRKPADDSSGVHVFALTLERSPVEMWIMPTVFGNIYQPGEEPAMTATLYGIEPTSCKLEWTVRDIRGKVLEQHTRDISFAKAGEETQLEIPFARKDLGWYQVEYRLAGRDGRELLRHTAYFALIDTDRRKAGYESPYFTWNFGGAHGTIKDINVSGPLLLKAGIRHTHVASEEVGKPWKLTFGQLSRMSPRSTDPQEVEKELERLIKAQLEKYPHASQALIFHESGGGPFPLEIVGGRTEVSEQLAASDKARVAHVELIARAYRKHAPHIKLVVGNSGMATPGLLAQLFRAGVPREYIDYIGEESVGMTMPPEISVARENWILKEVARIFGYGDIPINACYEWKCRRSRHLGLERLAEWNVRDILIAHAWQFPLISTVGLPDVSYSYYNTVWGDEAFTHNPQVYPKPGYPAVATATQVLDCAKFTRAIPTGSLTVYALEFTRENDFIYAFWTARGEVDTMLELERDATVTHTEMLGHSSPLTSAAGKLTIRVGEGAVYLTSPVALKSVATLGERSFPREQPPAGANIVVAVKMDKLEDWTLDMSVDPRIGVPAKAPVNNTSFRRPGKFTLRQVTDDRMGDCLELELIKEGECPALMQEYTFLKLVKPVELPGAPATLGLRVNGNSSWGKIFWEIEDAEGEKWLSAGTGGYGCDTYDWPQQAGINFDGWHFVQFPITGASPITVQSPGQDGYQWQHDGTGNRKIDYPIKVTGFAVSMPRQTLNLLEMQEVNPVLRFKELSAY